MNQAILINDGYVYNHQHNAIYIEAQLSGQLVPCYIRGVDENDADRFYQRWQFDIEDLLTEQLEMENWNEQGEIWMSALQFIG